MKRSCSSLKYNEAVIFLIYSDIYKKKVYETGTVVSVQDDSVTVSWLDGYRDRHDNIPFSDMVAVHNPCGEYVKFDNISGKSDELEP